MTAKRFPRGIMATCCVPWDSSYQFAEDVFRRSVLRMLAHGTRSLYVFGTAGEGYAVSESQFDRIVRAFSEEMLGAKADPMVGIISLSAATIEERIRRCRDLGVTLFQISLPSWGALSETEMFRFFRDVCGHFPDCRFVHYNLMRSKRLITGREYGRLAAEHPNLVGTKNCGDSLSHIYSLLHDAPQLQHFLSETGYVYGSLFGECSILASFIMNWQRLRELLEAGIRHDVATLTAIQKEVTLVLRTLFEVVPDSRIDGAYDILFEKMYDPDVPLNLLPPYVGSSEDEFLRFVTLLKERLPHWVPSPD